MGKPGCGVPSAGKPPPRSKRKPPSRHRAPPAFPGGRPPRESKQRPRSGGFVGGRRPLILWGARPKIALASLPPRLASAPIWGALSPGVFVLGFFFEPRGKGSPPLPLGPRLFASGGVPGDGLLKGVRPYVPPRGWGPRDPLNSPRQPLFSAAGPKPFSARGSPGSRPPVLDPWAPKRRVFRASGSVLKNGGKTPLVHPLVAMRGPLLPSGIPPKPPGGGSGGPAGGLAPHHGLPPLPTRPMPGDSAPPLRGPPTALNGPVFRAKAPRRLLLTEKGWGKPSVVLGLPRALWVLPRA